MPGRLQDRIALVTGASSGLGREICLAFAAEGAKLCCVDLYAQPRSSTNPDTGKAADFHHRVARSESIVDQLARLHGSDRVVFVAADVTDAGAVEAAVARCVAVFGRLDIMANNAGISVESTHVRPHGVHELSEADWDTTMAVNAKGVFLGCKFAIAQMLRQESLPGVRDRGWVLNTASIQGLVTFKNTPAYTASKGAVAQLTKSVAVDYAPHRIHCNSICPGFLKTSMTQNLQNDPRELDSINGKHPFGGMGDPADVAKVAVFLVSDDVAWVTGVNLPVDGGYTAM